MMVSLTILFKNHIHPKPHILVATLLYFSHSSYCPLTH